MKHIYLKGLSFAVVVALGLTSCSQQVENQNLTQTVDDSVSKVTLETTTSTTPLVEIKQTTEKEQRLVDNKSLENNTNVSKGGIKRNNLSAREERKVKGIEEIALYRAQISKRVGEEKSGYEKGYLVKEYNKAKENYAQQAPKLQQRYSAQFQERGPSNVPGRARAIQVNPNNLDNWFVGSAGGGIWETNDGGVTWSNNTDYTIPNLATPSIDSPTSNPSILYAGTGEPYGHLDAIGGFGIVKSTNGGNSWEFLASTAQMGDVGRLVVDPANANTVVAATVTGIYKTTDGGQNWNKTKSSGYHQDLVYQPGNYNVMYATERGVGVFKSTDAGNTWSLIFNSSAFNSNIARMEIDVSAANTNKIIVAAYQYGTTGYYLSSDGGNSFTELNADAGSDGNILGSQGWYDNALSFHPFNEDVFYSGGIYMAKVTIKPSNHSFSTQPIAAGYGDVSGQINRYVHVDMQNIDYVINPNNANEFRLILVCDGGVYYTDYGTDPGTQENDWSTGAIGMNSTQFYGADKKNGEDKYVAGAQDNGTWASRTANPNEATSYAGLFGGDGFKALWNYDDTDIVLVSSQYNNFARLNYNTGGGNYASHADQGSTNSPFYSKLSNVNNNAQVVFSVSRNGIWRSPDFGASWDLTPIDSNWNPSSTRTSSSLEVAASIANPNIVWGGGAMFENGQYTLYVSQDNGLSYSQANTYTDPRANIVHNYYLSGLATSSVNADRAYALFSGYQAAKVLRTNDMGQTWEDISGFAAEEDRGFPDVAVHALLEMPFDENIIWVGTDIGIFETLDGGASWHIVPDFIAVAVFDLKYVNDEVVISTHGRGVWSAAIPELLNFDLPAYVKAPIVTDFHQADIHDMKAVIEFSYESPEIESISVYIDGTFVTDITNGLAPNQTTTYTTSQTFPEGLHTVELYGNYGSNKTIPSSIDGLFIAFYEGKSNINIDEFETADMLSLGEHKFVIDNANGKFSYDVLNNEGHPYADDAEYIAYVKTPFLNTVEGVLTLTHMALTEGGYDFAVVEASDDLRSWITLESFTENSFADWNNVSTSGVNESLFKASTLDFSTDFAENTEVVIRLRLTTDGYETRYGWVVKSLVNEDKLAVTDVSLDASVSTAKIVPNPVEKNVNIYLSDKSIDKANVDIYDVSGRLIASYKDVTAISNIISIPFKKIGPGNYVAVIKAGDFSKSINFIKK